ncbi:NAD(P)-dependent oxidoreductase [Mesorhizobium sp. LHD-90]|uniref:NAD(P)-dependent oxidoreductase n=1 Tax=Mesorhizobium sp. LHD-90 TaxID=3071414 RepID=UPI0027E09913|nr:NAD(P)-dependent oxidoreductase [Mesorhizobium sp. LHD-90]MDQ6434837.1 NAD(P)-dependent oxidoreductase [Mesorhizobium sp. LHD-90]
MNVLFRFDGAPWLAERVAALQSEGLSVTLCSEQEDSAYLAALTQADVLWHVLRPITDDAIGRAPKLKLIQKIGVGVNTIDLDAAKKRGIAVCNMPGTNSRAVAELTLLLMLACLRRTVGFDAATRAGEGWSWPLEWQGGLGEIGGRTVGLVGFGAVPRLLAPILTAMGAEVIYTGRRSYADVHLPFVTKEELLARADILSLHVPLGEDTLGWLDAGAIAAMKPGAIVVNVARGAQVDEAALVAALSSGHVAAAGLDVFAAEPPGADNPLFALPSVVVSPHIAWLTRETIERSLAVAAENCCRLATGEPLLHRMA